MFVCLHVVRYICNIASHDSSLTSLILILVIQYQIFSDLKFEVRLSRLCLKNDRINNFILVNSHSI